MKGRGDLEFSFKTIRKSRCVIVKKLAGTDEIDVAHLDMKIALAGAPNRTKYRGLTTYKRRGSASPTLLPIYRETL